MRYFSVLLITLSMVLWSSCRNDFETVPSTGNLEFSDDTIFLDTVFTNIGSSTYTFKVYNRSDEDVSIPSLRLGQGESSLYRLNVDGVPGKEFEEVRVLANDSIFVFVETTIDINNLPNNGNTEFLYTDQILFDPSGSQQVVELVTLVQDAVFLFPDRDEEGVIETIPIGIDEEGNEIAIQGFFLDDDQLTFTNEKPYVIYGYAAVPSGRTLTVEAGARVHFHASSGILVAENASMRVNGAPSSDPEAMENEVIFEGDRLEPSLANVPGQWGTIWLTQGSTDHQFTHTTIRNGIVGLLMDSNDGDRTLTLSNVQIYNSSNVGLLARTADVYAENLVIGNSGQVSLACSLGGRYTFNHCTFGNYWTNSFRTLPAVLIDNVLQVGENEFLTADLVQADFSNCIIYGNEFREIGFIEEPSAAFNFNFRNSLIRFEDTTGEFEDDPNYNFSNPELFTNVVLNADPVFQDTEIGNLNIETGSSAADGIGLPSVPPPFDLNGIARSVTSPDAGAYESTVFPDPDGQP